MKITDRSMDMLIVVNAIGGMLQSKLDITDSQFKEYIWLLDKLSGELMNDNEELYE